MEKHATTMEKIVSLSKRRGFVFQSSEIYGGQNGAWDYGPLGIEIKNNIQRIWWREMTQLHDNIVGLDASILMHSRMGAVVLVGIAFETAFTPFISSALLTTISMRSPFARFR